MSLQTIKGLQIFQVANPTFTSMKIMNIILNKNYQTQTTLEGPDKIT